jgi:endonuclease-3
MPHHTPQQKAEAVFAILAAANPHPVTELVYQDDFTLLVAVVLSAQSTDRAVNLATAKLFAVANTPQAMRDLGVEGLKPYIQTIGLFNTKAANLIKLCDQLITQHGGQVPDRMEALQELAGVGRKTANVVLNTAFGQPTMAVDTHIFRVSNRLGLAKAKNVAQTEQQLLAVIPPQYLQHAHHWLILHGRYCCTARKPQCAKCPLVAWCDFESKFDEAP